MSPQRRDDYDDHDRDDYDDRPSRRRDEEYDRPSRRSRDDPDDYDDDRPSRRRGFECPYCGSTRPPIVRSQMSQAGLIVMIVMLFFCFPLFFIGLLMTEEVRDCSECGRRIN